MTNRPDPLSAPDLPARIAAHVNFLDEREPMLQEHACVKVVLDSIPDNFFAFSSDWRYVYFNKRAEQQMRQIGKDPQRCIGRVLWDEFPYVPNEKTFRRVMSERVPLTDEVYYAPMDYWVENHVYPMDDGGMVIFQTYITERKREQTKLRRSEEYLAEAQKLSHTGSWVWNLRTKELFWSTEHFRIFGLDPASVQPTYATAMNGVHPNDRARLEQAFAEAIVKCGEYSVDCRVIRPNGEVRHVRSMARPAFDDNGGLVEYIGTVVDMTERVEAGAALRRSQEALSQALRVLSLGALTASIAHELNQPLAAIVANGAACRRWLRHEPPALDEAQRAAQTIIRDGTRARQMLNRIFQFVNRGERSKGTMRIDEFLGETVNAMQADARANEVSVRLRVANDLPPIVGDAVQLQQVILNLMMNAIEAMSSGGTRPRILTIEAKVAAPGEIQFAVSDSGPGVAPDKREQVFEAFYTTKPSGLGLGLTISRSVVEEHRGRLWISTEPGEGTTFNVVLPTEHRE